LQGKAICCSEKKQQKFCSYRRYGKIFPADKIMVTGNPVRRSIVVSTVLKKMR